MRPPCYTPERPECPNRKVGCQVTCPEWAKWDEYKTKMYEDRKQEREAIEAMRDTSKAVKKKWLKNERNKRR